MCGSIDRPYIPLHFLRFMTFLERWSLDSIRLDSCLAAQNHVLLFKGPSSSIKISTRRKCRGIKGLSIYITHIPPPLSFCSTFNSANACRAMQNIDDKKADGRKLAIERVDPFSLL